MASELNNSITTSRFSIGIFDTTDITATGLQPSSYDDEKVINYELGYKGSLLDNTLQMFVSLYRYKYDDYQLFTIQNQIRIRRQSQ